MSGNARTFILGCRLVNVLTEEIYQADIVISGDTIASVRTPSAGMKAVGSCDTIIDADGLYAVPGLMDAHIHTDSTMLTLGEICRLVVPRGTTAIFTNPHEIANVLGMRGTRFLLGQGDSLPLRTYVQAPCNVPAAPKELETSGSFFGQEEIEEMLNWPGVVSIGEVIGYDLVNGSPADRDRYLEMIASARSRNKRITGHLSGLSDAEVEECALLGITDDHECTTAEEALLRTRLGITVFVREGSSERNLEALVGAIRTAEDYGYGKAGKSASGGFCFCTDDRHPTELFSEGHIDYNVRKAIALGIDPIKAIQMATINCARHYGLHDRLGSISPGKKADIVLVEDLRDFAARMVIQNGSLAAKDGALVCPTTDRTWPSWARDTVIIPEGHPSNGDFRVTGNSARSTVRVRAIEVVRDQIITKHTEVELPVTNGEIQPDPSSDVLKLVVMERHTGSGRTGTGFVRGFGLRKGAIGSSVGHDAHNLVVAGCNDLDIEVCLRALAGSGGGLVVVSDGKVEELVPLPVGGLISEMPYEAVVDSLRSVTKTAAELGCRLPAPFMTLSFLSLPVIPELRLTDRGLVDVTRRRLVPLEIA